MFNFVDKGRGLLFSSADLGQVLEAQVKNMRSEVEALDGERLLNTAPADLVDYLVKKFTVAPLKLRRQDWAVTESEQKIDVSRDSRRAFFPGHSGPFFVPGQRIEILVPFDGDSELFYARANQFTMNPPRAAIRGNELVLSFESPNDVQQDIKPEIDRRIQEIEEHLAWGNAQVAAINQVLPSEAQRAVDARRQRLLANQNRLASLGIPIRERAGMPKTYAVPTVRKKAAPSLPAASIAPYSPEPVWEMGQYEHALEVIQNMALVMERSPSAFVGMNEEALRQHFLVQLNGQFEGRAAGETFNFEGKTDILLRENGRNVFIAECKFWKGPKKFYETIDQLLGYTSWRDTKTAIIVFNRGTDTTTVLAGIRDMVAKHPNLKRTEEWKHESGMRYVLHQTGDRNRELMLTVLVFHVPA